MKNNEEFQIFTWRNPPKITPEVNDQPSLTDDTFFEPLPVLVDKILRGESTTLGDSTAAMFEYDGDSEVDFDSHESDFIVDDLTDIDISKNVLSTVSARTARAGGLAGGHAVSPRNSDSNAEAQPEVVPASDGKELANSDGARQQLGGEGA